MENLHKISIRSLCTISKTVPEYTQGLMTCQVQAGPINQCQYGVHANDIFFM